MAGLLSGMQGKVSACHADFQKVQGLRKDVYLPFRPEALAEVLPGMPGEAEKDTGAGVGLPQYGMENTAGIVTVFLKALPEKKA
ncbi:MAG: hypothetical protein J6M58_01760 [Clostridium sp.]|nr:hypothetical protein [Clostridium sp.]